MSFVVSSLSNYTNEQKKQFIIAALYGGETMSILGNAGRIQPGIKSAEAIQLLDSTIFFQTDGCGYNPSGTTTLTQRTITVGKIKIEETMCPKTLTTKWTQIGLNAGAEISLGEFTEQIGSEKAAQIAQAVEKALWQSSLASADTNLNKFDGFLAVLDALGFGGAGDPIQGNSNPTLFASITASNIDDILFQIYDLIPEGVLSQTPDKVKIMMGRDTFRKYQQFLTTGNLFHYTSETGNTWELPLIGTDIMVKGLPGLSTTNAIIACSVDNMVIGTDLIGEEEEYKLWHSQDNDEVRFRSTFKLGTQFARPAEVVYFKL